MKLQAAILFAATNAQRDGGRVRDKEVSLDDSAFNDYFGTSNYDFGYDSGAGFDAGSYEAFGADDGAFGDLSFGDYDSSYEAADAADEGRPVEEVDDVKSTFEQGVLDSVAPSSLDTVFSERCFNGVANDRAAWLTAGAWERCPGETQACEIKVVRRDGVITQIHSKCADQFSCVNNMKQNFNPQKDSPGDWFQTFGQQQCRPLELSGYIAANIGPRQRQVDSTCFFCVEPCSDDTVTGFSGASPSVASAAAMQAAQCIGKANTFENTKPIAASAVDILGTETELNVKPAGVPALDGTSNNFYLTTTVTMTFQEDGRDYADVRTVSFIQRDQKGFTP